MWQMIHMKCQDLFSTKKKESPLLQILVGAVRVIKFGLSTDDTNQGGLCFIGGSSKS